MAKTFKSPCSTKLTEVQDGDKFVFIVIASAGHADDWAAYRLALGEHWGIAPSRAISCQKR